jgi:hypothetical protein
LSACCTDLVESERSFLFECIVEGALFCIKVAFDDLDQPSRKVEDRLAICQSQMIPSAR